MGDKHTGEAIVDDDGDDVADDEDECEVVLKDVLARAAHNDDDEADSERGDDTAEIEGDEVVDGDADDDEDDEQDE